MSIVAISLGVYLVSMMAMYSWIRISHSEGGALEGVPLKSDRVWMTFAPVANTTAALMAWLFYSPLDKGKKGLDLNKFFQIKKKENHESKN